MTILKLCSICYYARKWRDIRECFFEGKLQDPIDLCIKHNTPENRTKLIQKFIHSRFIPIEQFDVWDGQYQHEHLYYKYERVCRICGKRLIDSKGKYNGHKRYCNSKTCHASIIYKSWNDIKFTFLHALKQRNEATHCLLYLDQISEERDFLKNVHYIRNYICCENCRKLVRNIEIHHKVPVCTLDESNYYLIWEESNLIALCHECHAKAESHNLFRKKSKEEKRQPLLDKLQSKYKNFQKIDSFLIHQNTKEKLKDAK